jgi:hypothetical protein
MGFKRDEIRIEIDEEAVAEGLTVTCPKGHAEWMHPEMQAPENEPFWCGECGHTFGTWGEVHRRLFTGGAMLAEALARKP